MGACSVISGKVGSSGQSQRAGWRARASTESRSSASSQEMAAMRPSLLQSPREGRDIGARFRRGVRDGQRRDELLVGRPVVVLKRLRYDTKYKVAYRRIQHCHQISWLYLSRRQNTADIDIIQGEASLRIETAFHVLNKTGNDQLRNILLLDALVAPKTIPSLVVERIRFHACEVPAPIGASAPKPLESAVPYRQPGSGAWRRARRVRKGTEDRCPSLALRSASPRGRRPAAS